VNRALLTDSKQKTKINSAMDVVPEVFIAATEKTKHMKRYAASMYRGLKAFIIIRPLARKRLNAYRPCATARRSAAGKFNPF